MAKKKGKTERKGKKQRKIHAKPSKSKHYKVSGDSITRTNRACAKCGAGVFMASHKDRWTCGACGYTEMKK